MSTLRNTAPKLKARVGRAAAVLSLALAGFTAACSETPSSPAAPELEARPAAELISEPVYGLGLVRDYAIEPGLTTTIRVGKAGGKFRVAGGLTVEVPAHEFSRDTTLTVTPVPGTVVAYEFQPHGVTFRKGLRLTQDLNRTNWTQKDLSQFEIGYFANSTDLDAKLQRALVKEFLRANIDVKAKRLSYDVYHFSGYMVSWGRRGALDAE